MKGQFGQPMMIEKVLKNNKFWKKSTRGQSQNQGSILGVKDPLEPYSTCMLVSLGMDEK